MKEIWRDIPDWEGYYEISTFGKVRSKERRDSLAGKGRKIGGFILIGDRSFSGRARYTLSKYAKTKTYFGAQLVLLTFVGPPPFLKAEARHLDDDPTRDHLNNLAWGTRKDNAEDALRNGKYLMGDTHPSSKLSDVEVRKIRKLYKWHSREFGTVALGRRFGVTAAQIHYIVQGKFRRSA